jgi:polyhydroxyalkanoate synthesis regulator phasin
MELNVNELIISTTIATSALVGVGIFVIKNYLKGYLPEKGKLLATTENFQKLQDQLISNTKLVQEITNKFSDKSWASQQVWSRKQEAYETIWINLNNMKNFVAERLQAEEAHYEAYFDYGGSLSFPEQYTEAELKSYYEMVEQDKIEDLKYYSKTYGSTAFQNKFNEKRDTYIQSLNEALAIIEIKSIYLNPKVFEIKEFLSDLITHLKENHSLDKAYTEDVANSSRSYDEREWRESLIDDSRKLLKSINNQMIEVKKIALEELNLNSQKSAS